MSDNPAVRQPRVSEEDTDDDDATTLSANTMAILQTFLREQAEREAAMSVAISGVDQPDSEHGVVNAAPKFHAFQEDWVSTQFPCQCYPTTHSDAGFFSLLQQMSQFWYNNRTKQMLADVCRQLKDIQSPANLNIALLSCPSLYDSVRAAVGANEGNVHLFEYDTRFAAYGSDFVHYDYKQGADPAYLAHLAGQYDVVIVDPPFLSDECIERTSLIVRRLCNPSAAKVILCSGGVVAEMADKHMGLKRCDFEPQHERNLANEFGSYANFDLDEFIRKCAPIDE